LYVEGKLLPPRESALLFGVTPIEAHCSIEDPVCIMDAFCEPLLAINDLAVVVFLTFKCWDPNWNAFCEFEDADVAVGEVEDDELLFDRILAAKLIPKFLFEDLCAFCL